MRKIRYLATGFILATMITSGCKGLAAESTEKVRHSVPKEHPRLLGSAQSLKELARQRPEAYARVVEVARSSEKAGNHEKMISLSLVYAIEGDEQLGAQAVQMAMKYVDGPIRSGHVTFGHDLARCAIVYDLCYPCWTEQQRLKFHEYVNNTVDANVRSESHVFHNGWYGYKHWGYGLAGYASYYENPRAPEIIKKLDHDIRTLATPALILSGDGGGFGEGYYINYWLYEWLFFCEVARLCEGIDYYELAPQFFANRAVAGMFEAYPGIREYNSRRPIPMGDGGGRRFGGDRDKALSARRILVNHYRNDLAHNYVHTFNEATPVSGVSNYAYKDFLWRESSVPKGDLKNFKLSHISPGPGYVYARSSWDKEATYFFFKCGDRFTAHQHLDNGHFLIYKHEELAADGGQYYYFGNDHDANYHLRTIAHSTMLIHDPKETWPGIRAFKGRMANDGGQHHNWPHHNGAVVNAEEWQKDSELYDIADILAFEDQGSHLYVAGDCSHAYSPDKLEYFTRQIVFIRPGTFVIFDRVKSTNADFKKTWLLQAMKPPAEENPHLVITNGRGRLFVQTLLPRDPEIRLASGENLHCYDNGCFSPEQKRGSAPECRVEVSPPEPAVVDYFLHVLTATSAEVERVPEAVAEVSDTEVAVTVGEAKLFFTTRDVGGRIEINGQTTVFANSIVN